MLELPYRKVALCTGDMGFGATKTYDLEVMAAGVTPAKGGVRATTKAFQGGVHHAVCVAVLAHSGPRAPARLPDSAPTDLPLLYLHNLAVPAYVHTCRRSGFPRKIPTAKSLRAGQCRWPLAAGASETACSMLRALSL